MRCSPGRSKSPVVKQVWVAVATERPCEAPVATCRKCVGNPTGLQPAWNGAPEVLPTKNLKIKLSFAVSKNKVTFATELGKSQLYIIII